MRPRAALGIGIVGLGLILAGGAAWSLLSEAAARANQGTDFLAIPSVISAPAPNLELTDIFDRTHRLSDYRGQVALINLWATWCPPCQAEMPNLQQFFDRHRDEGFQVIAINDGDPRDAVMNFASERSLTFEIWLDPGFLATDQAFKTSNLPSSYVMDRQGILRLAWFGAISEANLEKYVTPLIQEP